MKLRTDLWKGASGSPAFAELKKRLQDFLSHTEWTTLLLKGPWGCGKTSAVKSLLEEATDSSNKDRLQIKTYSFISLAGLPKITDERSLFLSGFENWNDLPVKKMGEAAGAFGKIARTLLGATGLGSRAEGVADLFALAITPFMNGALVVLDELERRSEDLPFEDVTGAVMRLVEQRGCKVIVISNEDALDEKDKEKLNAAREKIFDLEFLFTPSVADAVRAVVPGESDRQRLLPVFEALGVNNLRIISKVHAAAAFEFAHLLPNKHREARERVLENVVKICSFRWLKGSIQQKMLNGAFFLQMTQEMNLDPDRLQNNPIADLIIKTNFEPSEADATILDYLTTGRVDEPGLRRAFEVEKSRAAERHAVAVLQKLADAFSSSFGPIDSRLLDDGQHVLDNSIEAFSEWAYVYRLFHLLEFCGRKNEMSLAERRWARGARFPQGGSASEYTQQLNDPQAKEILQKRFEERDIPAGFENLPHLLAQRNYPEAAALIRRNLHDSAWLLQQIQSANVPTLMHGLIGFLKWLDHPDMLEQFASVRQALREALERLASANPLNRERVNYILKSVQNRVSPPTD